MKYTIYKDRFVSATGSKFHMDGEWNDIVQMVCDKSSWPKFHATTKEEYDNAKAKFDAVVMAEMKPNTSRTADNVIAFHAIVLDIDDGATYEEVRKDLKDYEYVMYSSGGTGLKSGDRFRVILPLNTPMVGSEWKRYNTSLTERFPYSDECFKKGIQIQYLPVVNGAYANKFIGEYHRGQWFDYQNPKDLPFVENLSIESIVKNVVFDEAQFTDEEMLELAKAIIEHQSGQLEYEERRLLAQRLKHIGMNDFDIIQVLEQVSRAGYSVSNQSIVAGANPQYAHVEGLYKHVAKGTRIPAIERRIVRYSASTVASVAVAKYDGEWTLGEGEYLSDVSHDMDFTSGVNLLIADVGTGKTVHWTQQENVKFVAPLTSIVASIGDVNSLTDGDVGTWNQIESIIREKDKSKFKELTLVVDECHGLFVDYGYKSKTINRLIDTFKYFKSVVLMSGTVEADYYSSIKFNKVYRVRKPSKAKKTVRTFFCTKKDEILIDWINSLTNKTIVLINDKDLGSVVSSKINRKNLVVNADVKKTDEVNSFFKNKAMGDYEVIIGTNSIVEGLSIEDELNDVDIVIWSDLVPERIEQFCNRFRNVSNSKNVWYFVDRRKVEIIDDYKRSEVLEDAHNLCVGLQKVYEDIQNETLQRSFIRQFGGEMARDLVYFHEGKFNVSFTGIDYEYSEYREKQYRNDFSMFAGKLTEYGYDVLYPISVDGDEKNAEEIKEAKAVVKAERIESRKQELESLISDIDTNTVKEENEASDLYNSTYESIQKLLARGMDKKQVSYAISEYIEDEKFFAKAHEDAEYFETGNTIREMIIDEVNGKNEITSEEKTAIADKIAIKVLREYFNNDIDEMVKSRSWGKWITKNENNIQVSSSSSATKILMQYIKLGESKKVSRNGVKIRVTMIQALSRTGLQFTSGTTFLINDLYKSDQKVVPQTFSDMVQAAYDIVKGLDVYQRAAYASSLFKKEVMSEEDKATYIACSKFAKIKKQSVQAVLEELN
ncbi:hypothetical protein FMJ45_25585 [Klebsiella michiganensis]|nr:hypothetical protein [Klebsiella michiganensis]MBF8474307.1 hypothetical protein [Klebsiella michiganensis]MBZ6604501.1 hypothetical protein [Klebsiella michiganensis]